MSIKWEFSNTNQDGSPAISMLDWVTTLTPAEITEFNEARVRQRGFAQQLIDAGFLTIGQDGSFTWSVDPTTVEKQFDPVWSAYRTRYIEENNIKFGIAKTEL